MNCRNPSKVSSKKQLHYASSIDSNTHQLNSMEINYPCHLISIGYKFHKIQQCDDGHAAERNVISCNIYQKSTIDSKSKNER